MSQEKKGGLLHASERDGVNYRKAKLWEILVGTSSGGAGIGFYLLLAYAGMIATEGFAVAVVTAGVVITVSSFIDAVSDALVASAFELFHPKRGKVRMFLLAGWGLSALSALLLYRWATGRLGGIAGVVLFFVLYNLFRTGYTAFMQASSIIGVVLTNDPTQRPMLGVVSTAYSYVVPLIFTNLATFYILPKYDNMYNTDTFAEMVLWYVGITFFFTVLACFGIRRVDVRETFETVAAGKGKDEKIKVKDMVSVLKDNRNVQMYMLTTISDRLASNISSQSMINTMLAGVLIGSYAASTMVGNFSQIVGIVFAFSGGIFIAKWGAKRATTIWSWVCIAIAAVTVVFCIAIGGPNGMGKIGVWGAPIVIYAILTLARTGANMVITTTASAMRGDIVDYEYERSGKYMPAIVAGVTSFIDKIVGSFSAAIAGACVAMVGYVNTVPQMGDVPTWPIFWMTMFLVFGMPILGWLCNIVAMKFYTLDKERMVEVQRNLAERKAAVERGEAVDVK